jgi:hypothetical protein
MAGGLPSAEREEILKEGKGKDTIKKESKFFLIYKEVQKGSGAKHPSRISKHRQDNTCCLERQGKA